MNKELAGVAISLFVLLILVYIVKRYSNVLTDYQGNEAIIGTILFVIILGYMRAVILEKSDISAYTLIPAVGFIFWYVLTKITVNNIHRDVYNSNNINFD